MYMVVVLVIVGDCFKKSEHAQDVEKNGDEIVGEKRMKENDAQQGERGPSCSRGPCR